MLSILFAAFLSLHAYAQPDFLEDVIYNGRAVAPDGQTWHSTVGLAFTSTDGKWYACSGVLIESDVILTAAHCDIKNGGELQIKLYKNNSKDSVTELWPAPAEFRFVKNPRYSKSSAYDPGTNDLAVLVLRNQEIPDDFYAASIQTAAQASASDPGRTVTVVGAGMTDKGKMSTELRFAQGQITNYLAGGLVQIQFSGSGVCGGDSGGPVFVSVGKDLYLSGLTTSDLANYGGECGNVLYSNYIDAARYQWITATSSAVRAQLEKAAQAAAAPKAQ